jgi:hypothetical protein
MIRISCTNCREVLTIDDAFAGGVCRCQHCGTIQTVPATAAAGEMAVGGGNLGGARIAGPGASPYGSGTGLDDLAGAVASSGLSSRRLLGPDGTPARPSRARSPAAAQAPSRKNLVPLFVAAAVVIALLLGVIVYLATRQPALAANGQTTSPANLPNSHQAPDAPAAANFCGTPLSGDTVVYVLDRGSSTQEVFAALRDAALKSAGSLGSEHHFQIIFWPNAEDEQPTAFPQTGTAYATGASITTARHALEDVTAFGQTDAKPAVALAMKQNPDVVVIATAKGWELTDAWVHDILAARGSSSARFATFSLGNDNPTSDATPPLKTLADKTGGPYAVVSNDALRAASE